MTTPSNPNRVHAQRNLRWVLTPGSQVTVLVRTVSRTGMLRRVSVLRPAMRLVNGEVRPTIEDITGLVAIALDMTRDKDGYLAIRGTGFNVGTHLVGNLSWALYQDEYRLVSNTLY